MHVILHQIANFHPNRSIPAGVMML